MAAGRVIKDQNIYDDTDDEDESPKLLKVVHRVYHTEGIKDSLAMSSKFRRFCLQKK